jgi:hypothetical protein
LMLWVKHVHMIFDKDEENISQPQQVPITEWLTNCTDELPESLQMTSKAQSATVQPVHRQTNLVDWLKSWGGDDTDCDTSSYLLTDNVVPMQIL